MRCPPWDRVASRTELKKNYDSMREEIAGYQQAAKNSGIIARKYRIKADEATSEKKIADRQLLYISKQKKSKDEATKAGYWSGAAAIFTTILYQAWKTVGFPGGAESFWTHDAVHGTLLWVSTCCFAWLYKFMHDH